MGDIIESLRSILDTGLETREGSDLLTMLERSELSYREIVDVWHLCAPILDLPVPEVGWDGNVFEGVSGEINTGTDEFGSSIARTHW